MHNPNFYTQLSLKAQAKFFAAVFFTFAPLFILSTVQVAASMSLVHIAWLMIGPGIIAVGYAFASIKDKRWFAVAVPLHLGIVVLSAMFTGWEFKPSAVGLACVAVIVVGYIFFVSFINSEGAWGLRLQTEINLAEQVHTHLVPFVALQLPWVEVHGSSLSSGEVGGDLIDVVQDDSGLNAIVADVSGHGMKAGVLMSMVKSAIRMKMLGSIAPDELCSDLNTVVRQVKQPDMFVTLAYLRVDSSLRVQYALAGHPPILHYGSTSKTVTELTGKDPGLGLIPGHRYTAHDMMCKPGDMLVILTDGLVEVEDAQGTQFGMERIKELISSYSPHSAANLHSALLEAVHLHGKQVDDQSLAVVKFF